MVTQGEQEKVRPCQSHPWRGQQKLLGSSPKLYSGPPLCTSFGKKPFSLIPDVWGQDGMKPDVSACGALCFAVAGCPSGGRCLPGGDPTMCWEKDTAEQALSKHMCIQHI